MGVVEQVVEEIHKPGSEKDSKFLDATVSEWVSCNSD